MVAPLWVNRDYQTTMDVRSAYWQFSISSLTRGQMFDPESLYEPI